MSATAFPSTFHFTCINLFSNIGPKGLLQVATKYKLTFTEYHNVSTHIFAYTHPHTYIHMHKALVCPCVHTILTRTYRNTAILVLRTMFGV